MPRHPQTHLANGSQKWIQATVNNRPDLIDVLLRTKIGLAQTTSIEWLSPRQTDDYAEYQDAAFLRLLGITPATPLSDFWPNFGPQWDALGKTSNGDLLLVEAKAHIPEMHSSPTQAKSELSLAKIRAALDKTKQAFAPKSDVEWSTNFYQYANRLAHLYWLREENNLPAYMVFVYFCGDAERGGPDTRQEWEGAIKLLETFMGIRQKSPLSQYVIDLFIDVRDLK